MTFNISCRSKIKNIQKVCGVQKSQYRSPSLGPLPLLGEAQRRDWGWRTEDGTDVVNTRRSDRNREQKWAGVGTHLGADEERVWRGESPGIVLKEGNRPLRHG